MCFIFHFASFFFFLLFLCEYHGSTCICKIQVLRSTDLTLARAPTRTARSPPPARAQPRLLAVGRV